MTQHAKRLTEADIDVILNEVRHRLIEAAHPDKIILFGSYARGDFDKDSDLDLLVILPQVDDAFGEMDRLEQILLPLDMPVDVVVYSVDEVRERGHLRG